MAEATTIIINELLYYVQNRVNNSPDEIIATTCVNFYSGDEIDHARNELFKALENSSGNGRVVTRRKDPKKTMEDIISTFKSYDIAKEPLPTYVSRNLHRVPHDDEGNQSIKCVMASLSKLERQLGELSRDFVTKSDLDTALNPIRQKISASTEPVPASTAEKKYPSYIFWQPHEQPNSQPALKSR